MSAGYAMLIQWSDEDRLFIVSLPEFGGFARTHGASYEEAARSGEEALELLVEAYRAEGRALPEPMTLQGSPELRLTIERHRAALPIEAAGEAAAQ